MEPVFERKGLSLNVIVSNLLWFNEWHQRTSSYYLHGLGHPLEKNYFQPRGEIILKLISVDRVLHGNDAIFRESVSTPNET